MTTDFYRFIYFQAQKLRGEDVTSAYRELKQSLHRSEEELILCQNARIKELLLYAVTNVPYYQDRYRKWSQDISQVSVEEVKSLMNELPVLYKRDILSERERFYSKNKSEGKSKIFC
jgi:phenylacetate-coenzyme A ligase PaaK-like adenylate-forming protein